MAKEVLHARGPAARAHRARAPIFALLTVATACLAPEGDLSTAWPEWQRITFDSVPAAWQLEEASPAFDAWQATTQLSVMSRDGLALLVFSDDRGRSLEVTTPALPRILETPGTQPVQLTLIERQGFEGLARGITARDTTGALLFLYDDGGYGPAFYDARERDGVAVDRELTGPGSREAWAARAVTFGFQGASVTLAEGEDGAIGSTGLRARVVVSREWTGAPPTDVDLTPLAYFLYRAGAAESR